MAIDSAPYIAGWNLNSPHVSDPRAEGANQIKAMKTAIHNCFPNVGGEVTADHNRMNQIFQAALPQVGMIMLFSGDTAPEGWAICDGGVYNSVLVPDLRGKFIMGATDEEGVGTTGSRNIETNMGQYVKAKDHALTESQIPAHRHKFVADDNLVKTAKDAGCIREKVAYGDEGADRSGAGTIYQTSATGGGAVHSHAGEHIKDFDNRPAYYALAFIMYVGFA